MLNQEQGYEENKNDFDEINNNIKSMGIYAVPSKKKEEVDDKQKLPFLTKLILFLCGFAYVGFLIWQVVWALILRTVVSDKTTFSVGVMSATYLSMFAVFVGIAIKHKDYFKNKFKDPTKYLYGIACGVITIGLEIAISMIISSFIQTETNANQLTVVEYTSNYPTIMFFITVLVGPMCEEITYRVGLFELLKEKNETMALIVTSLIFAFIHISFSDTTFLAEITSFPIYLTIGLCLTYGYKKYGLPCSYVGHLMLNLISFLSIMSQI